MDKPKYRGLPILPAMRGEKRPGVLWKDFQQVPPTEDEFTDLWDYAGDLATGVAMVTGPSSGVAVVDADNQAAVDWCYENLPNTPVIQHTKHGIHFFFKYIEGVANRTDYFKGKANDGPIIDIRGDRGIVMLAPTPNYELDGKLYKRIKNGTLPPFPLDLFPVPQAKKVTTKKALKTKKKRKARTKNTPTFPVYSFVEIEIWSDECRTKHSISYDSPQRNHTAPSLDFLENLGLQNAPFQVGFQGLITYDMYRNSPNLQNF